MVEGDSDSRQERAEHLRHRVEVLQGQPPRLVVHRPADEDHQERGEGSRGRRSAPEDACHVQYGLPDARNVAPRESEPVRPPQQRADDGGAHVLPDIVQVDGPSEHDVIDGIEQDAASRRCSGGEDDQPVDGDGVHVEPACGDGGKRRLSLGGLDPPVERPYGPPDERRGQPPGVQRSAVEHVTDHRQERYARDAGAAAEDEIDVHLPPERSRLRRMALHGALRRPPE